MDERSLGGIFEKDKTHPIEISVVGNGYIVYPGSREGRFAPPTELHVFESFAGLVKWMEDNLKQYNRP